VPANARRWIPGHPHELPGAGTNLAAFAHDLHALCGAHVIVGRMTDQPGRFRINWVAETTGVPEATLRAWERRYQVPKPQRTPSGYRLYSQDDVATVKRMRELCDAGISPADAAKEIQRDEKSEADSARRRKELSARVQPASAPSPSAADTHLAEMVGPEHTNAGGVLALNRAVALLERAAVVAASRAARTPCIVVSCGSIDLALPVISGQLLDATARIVATRENTLSVDVELSVENMESGQREHVTRATLVLVMLDAED
jgi:acyl-CoA hydrolase